MFQCLSPALPFRLKPTAARQLCPTTSCPRTTTTTTSAVPSLNLGALDDGDGSDLRGSFLCPVVVDATPPPLTALATMVVDARGGRRYVLWDGFLGASSPVGSPWASADPFASVSAVADMATLRRHSSFEGARLGLDRYPRPRAIAPVCVPPRGHCLYASGMGHGRLVMGFSQWSILHTGENPSRHPAVVETMSASALRRLPRMATQHKVSLAPNLADGTFLDAICLTCVTHLSAHWPRRSSN